MLLREREIAFDLPLLGLQRRDLGRVRRDQGFQFVRRGLRLIVVLTRSHAATSTRLPCLRHVFVMSSSCLRRRHLTTAMPKRDDAPHRTRSAHALIFPHRMTTHRRDVDGVTQPVQLLRRKRQHRLLTSGPGICWPPAASAASKILTDHKSAADPVAVTMQNANSARWNGSSPIDCSHDRQAVDARPEVNRFAVKIDRKIRRHSEGRNAPALQSSPTAAARRRFPAKASRRWASMPSAALHRIAPSRSPRSPADRVGDGARTGINAGAIGARASGWPSAF
jgi:hypothetical protein